MVNGGADIKMEAWKKDLVMEEKCAGKRSSRSQAKSSQAKGDAVPWKVLLNWVY